jgi:hypothetical protein
MEKVLIGLIENQMGIFLSTVQTGKLGRTDKFLTEGEAIIVGRKGSAGEVTRISGKILAI